MIKALIFDFDGLIIDTEVGVYQAWLEIYQEYGLDYPVEEYQKLIGKYSPNCVPLESLDHLKGPLDWDALDSRHRKRSTELSLQGPILPGVMNYLTDARRFGLKTAIASSSPRSWLDKFLEPRKLISYFDVIVTGDIVSHVKPNPELFLTAINQLGTLASDAMIFEDSMNGLLAARSAGIRCVIIPSKLTRDMTFHDADLVLDSLDSMPLIDLMKHFDDEVSPEEV